jgi:hypothetical protein
MTIDMMEEDDMDSELPDDLNQLSAMWLMAKSVEANATAKRRAVEDHIKKLTKIDDKSEGITTVKPGDYVVKIENRIDRKIDSEKLQELAAEHGLTEHLATICRWKPELNMTVWKSTDPSITRLLAGAITAKPGRPSFKITVQE